MYTQCPHCDTLFRISIPQLKAAHGKVRCGHCNSIFNALLNLSEQVQEIPTVNERAEHHAAEGEIGVTSPNLPNLHSVEADLPRPASPMNEGTADKPVIPKTRFTVSDEASEKPERIRVEFASPFASATSGSKTPRRPRATLRMPPQDASIVKDAKPHSDIRSDQTLPSVDEAVVLPREDDSKPLLDQPYSHEQPHANYDKQLWEPVPDVIGSSNGKARHEMIISTPRTTADRLHQEPSTDYTPPIFVPDRRAMPRLPAKEIMDYDALDDYPPEEAKPSYNWWSTSAWTLGILALLALLIAQYTYAMREDLAGYLALRPNLEKFCAAVTVFAECDIPLRRDLAQIEKLDSAVKSHPDVADALLVDTTLVNRAAFPQPYPHLQLTLSGIDGSVIAKRRFHPNEYLAANVNIRRGIQPGNALPIMLEIATPGTDFKLQSWSIDLF